MKRITAAAAVAVASVALAACGSSHKTNTQVGQLAHSAQTKQAESYARTVAEGCINKGGGLTKMFHCAVPPHHAAAFLKCAVAGAPKSIKGNNAAIETDLVKCGERYR